MPEVEFYIIYKQGYYGQGIQGICPSLKEASSLADLAAERDEDDYHSYDVYPVPMSQLADLGGDHREDTGWIEKEPLYSTRKKMILDA